MIRRTTWILIVAVAQACSAPSDLELRDPDAHPRYLVGERDGPINIDGDLADEGWARAHTTGAFRAQDGLASRWTEARFLIDDEALYIALDAQQWGEQTVIGIEIDVHGNFDPEADIWIEAIDVDSALPFPRQLTWDGSPGGRFDFRGSEDDGFRIELMIPLSQLQRPQAPEPGTVWRAKLYRLEDPEDLESAQVWTEAKAEPVESNEAFGYLDFLGEPLP